MPKRKYKDVKFNDVKQAMVNQAVVIVAEYAAQGYDLTLRQVYYQFVARDLFPDSWRDPATDSTNNVQSYKKLGDIISDARMAGLIDWHAIEDRTRSLSGNSHWSSPASIIASCAHSFQLDKWVDQEYRVEVWVEKDALEGVVGKAARELDVSFFSCRGYTSMTAIWDAGQRLKEYAEMGQIPVILHLGDHDPSGMDMSRDIEERVNLFMDRRAGKLVFERIALNMPQIRTYTPPPNPAKTTDSRFRKYQEEHGDDSWELDAIEPSVLDALIQERVRGFMDEERFRKMEKVEQGHREDLEVASSNWGGVTKYLKSLE